MRNENASLTSDTAGYSKMCAYRDSLEKMWAYRDSLKPVIFAKTGDFIFVYEDDFHWATHVRDTTCYFPGREAWYVPAKGETGTGWAASLDLFGIPCD